MLTSEQKKINAEFIHTFNQLESYLKSKEKGADRYQSFSSLVNQSNNKIINHGENRQFLFLVADLRNIIVHNNEVAYPTLEFMAKFKQLVKKITHPLTAEKVMIPFSQIKMCQIEETLFDAYLLMKNYHLSNIPIMRINRLIGVFNESTIFSQFINEQGEILAELTKVHFVDVIDKIKIEKQPSVEYHFVSRKVDIYRLFDYFKTEEDIEKKTELLFVTENGNEDESLLGLISVFDLVRHL